MTVLATLGRDRRGTAIMEFGLAIPLLLLMGLGGLETANYALTVFRLQQIAQLVADNAARVRQALDESDVDEVMIGAKLMGSNLNFATQGRIILSDVEQRTTVTGTGGQGTKTATNPNGYRQWIRWQRCAGALNKPSSFGGPIDANGAAVINLDNTTNSDHGAVEGASAIDGMGPTGAQIAATGGTAVMVVEIWYSYKPLIPLYAWGSRTLRVVQAYGIRQRTDFTIYNGNKLSGNGRSDCRLFDATVPSN